MAIWDLLCKHKEGSLSYQESVALFFEINPKSTLRKFFEVNDAMSRKKLNAALDKKYQELRYNVEQAGFKSYSVRVKGPINIEVLPEDLRKAYHRCVEITKSVAFLRGKLFSVLTNEERFSVAQRIVTLVAERTLNYRQIDEFVEKGTYTKPEEIKHTRVDKALPKNFEIEYELKLLRTRRSKLKKKPSQIDTYNQVVKRINELEKKRYSW